MDEPKHFYAFGPFRLDAGNRVLVRDGRPVPLAPKAAETLLVLVESAGRLVDKDDLMKRVWPDAFVDEANLPKNILVLRKVLGQRDDAGEYIETVPKRGYRFVAPVQDVTHAEEPARAKSGSLRDLIGKKVSHYRVLEVIGGGGMGLVYKAEDLKLGRRVALKFLPEELATDPVALRRFEREARTASSLSHPNICTIYEVEEFERQPFIVMELLEGETLRDRLASVPTGAIPLNDLLDIALQICEGLQAAHEKGIIHRDIKPANIFITRGGQVKILDFGLAKLMSAAEPAADYSGARALPNGAAATAQPARVVGADATLTRLGVAMGTAGYMSPEQVRGESLDARTDIFSFGLVLYEAATGRRAFTGETAAAVQNAIVHDLPPPVRQLNSKLPARFVISIDKALQKNRESRYQSAAEMHSDLEQLRTGGAVSFRHIRKWMGAAALLIVVAGGGWAYWQQQKQVRLTNQDTILLADFSNQTGDRVLGDALTTALRSELEQTPFLNLLGSDKVRGALKQMGRPENSALTPSLARDVCSHTNSKAVIEGTISDLGNRYRLQLTALACHRESQLASTETEVAKRPQIVHALGVAGADLRRQLGEPKESIMQFSKPLEEATSPSPEALQAYSEAVKLVASNYDAATPYFKRATELDQNFGMAHVWLGALDYNAKVEETKAYELRSRLTLRDRFGAEHMYYRVVTGELEKAVSVFEEWIRVFPLDAIPHAGLAITLPHLAQHERAAAEAREAMRLSPTLDAYLNLMNSDIALGRFDDARATYEEAESRGIDDPTLHTARFSVAFYQNDSAGMEEQLNWAAKIPAAKGSMFWSRALVEFYYGDFRRAHADTLQAMDWDHRTDPSNSDPELQATMSITDSEVGFWGRAHEEAKASLLHALSRGARVNDAVAFARSGDVATAQQLAEALNLDYPVDTQVQNFYLPLLGAMIDLEQHHPEHAIEMLQRATPYELAKFEALDQLYPAYIRGLAYLSMGQGKLAAGEFQKMIDHPGIVGLCVTGALAHLQLGRAQVMMDDKTAARNSYQKFLSLWKNADPDLPIYKQAKAEYAKLR